MSFTIPPELKLQLGTYPNDGTGDDIRTAFQKISDTLDLIDTVFSITSAENIGDGEGVSLPVAEDEILKLKSITGSNGIVVSADDTTIDISGEDIVVENDNAPTLGGNLSLNGYSVIGDGAPGGTGDIKSKVWGIEIRDLNDQVQTLLSNYDVGNLDFGSFGAPLTGVFDLGSF